MAQETITIKDGDAVAKEILTALTPDGNMPINTGMDLMLAMSQGLIDGYLSVDKFGAVEDIPTNNGADITAIGGDYTFDTRGTAPITHLSSSSTADVGISWDVHGLNILGERVQQTVISNGQNGVALSTPLWRVFTTENADGDDLAGGKDAVGEIYIGTESSPSGGVPAQANQRVKILIGTGRTLQAIYTIPLGYVGFLLRGELGVNLSGNASALAENASCGYYSRRNGKRFTLKKRVTCMVGGGSAVYQDVRNIPDVIPALTDVKLRADNVTKTMGMFGTANILLVPEDKIPSARLAEINQPYSVL